MLGPQTFSIPIREKSGEGGECWEMRTCRKVRDVG